MPGSSSASRPPRSQRSRPVASVPGVRHSITSGARSSGEGPEHLEATARDGVGLLGLGGSGGHRGGVASAAVRREASVSRWRVSRLSATAATTASGTSVTSSGRAAAPVSMQSAPAARAATTPGTMPTVSASAAISSASVTTVPPKPSSPRSSSWVMRGLTVAWRSGSSAGACRWPVITARAPASIPARNGPNSTASSSRRERSSTAVAKCESLQVAPWPGKCFRQAATPVPWMPRTAAATCRPATAGSAEKARSPITGLRGSTATSATGARFSVTPAAAQRSARSRWTACVTSTSSRWPSAAAPGERLPRAASSRVTRPPSSSIATTTSRPAAARAAAVTSGARPVGDVAGEQHHAAQTRLQRAGEPVRQSRPVPGQQQARQRQAPELHLVPRSHVRKSATLLEVIAESGHLIVKFFHRPACRGGELP